ncbi:kinase-like domain-containing protein [Mycotypha africana]|uniref:kinase-like domain-containing protein n=1 Tax=Mycotypha africana TaxID=64632 RepID=UPI0023019F0C|nr:kinase-like domain-containing protein [Mycotypha africana]KAI8970161.1 kinase-like domain-containing protein [Mycotypha africana]
MDVLTKGVQMIRRRSTMRHNRTASQESNSSSSSSPGISKTPSITSSITSNDGSCYSNSCNNVVTPSQTPQRNSLSNLSQLPASITITSPMDSPPASPVNKTPDNFKEEPVSSVPDYLSTSPTRASPLSPLPRLAEQPAPPASSQAVDSYFSLPIQPDVGSTTTTTNEGIRTSSLQPPRSPMRSHFSPRPIHVSSKFGTHASLPPRCSRAAHGTRRRQHRKLTLDDFILKRTVGTGSFGRVHLAQSKVNGKHYAIKVLDKYDVVRLKQVEHVNNEPTILREISHPFLITLWDAFQDDTHLFMVLDYIPGGELFRVLRKHKKFTEATAKFYAAEVLLALAYLHDNGIVYRDLKPENILIDARGHVKLTDFGFAKRVDDVTWTVCGTPDYLAPEIILSKGYTKAVDWWGLGVLIFEMVVGRAPFVEKNPVDLYQKILECRVDWPDDMGPTLKDLLSNLLTHDVEGRYTSKEIKKHPWFADINFEQVLRRKMKPPYIPKVKDDGDTTCFAKYKEPAHGYGRIRGDPFRSKFPAF